MKKRFLLTGLALVSSTAFAVPKTPDLVAQEWRQSIERSRQALKFSTRLAGQSDELTLTPLERIFSADNLAQPPPTTSRKREPLIDSPSYHIPQNLPNDRPRGGVPWEYNGQTYWLVPLAPPTGK